MERWVLCKLTQIPVYYWEIEKNCLDFGELDLTVKVTEANQLRNCLSAPKYLLSNGGGKEQNKVWRPRPYFQGQKSNVQC